MTGLSVPIKVAQRLQGTLPWLMIAITLVLKISLIKFVILFSFVFNK
jgi:hypothetical protein